MIWWQQKLSQMDTDAGTSLRTQFGEKQENVLQMYYKRNQSSNPASSFDCFIVRTTERKGL